MLTVSLAIGKAPGPNLGTVTGRFRTLRRFPQSHSKKNSVMLIFTVVFGS